MDDSQDEALPLEKVLAGEHEEIDAIRSKRKAAGNFDPGSKRPPATSPVVPDAKQQATDVPADRVQPAWQTRDKTWVDAVRDAHDKNLVGLAFSGGGIRSATFNLGVLQALADLKLLYRIDYLSTVSGGGYIGSWLAAWTKREKSFANVQMKLATNRVHQEDDKEPPPIRFLRMFSNYLTPRLGTLSGDTWATVGIYLRNVILIQTIVFAALAFVLLLPRVAEKFVSVIRTSHEADFLWLGVPAILLLTAFYSILKNMGYLDQPDEGVARTLTKQKWVLWLVGAPLFATAIIGALWLHVVTLCDGKPHAPPLGYKKWTGLGVLFYGLVWIAATLLGLNYRALGERLKATWKATFPGKQTPPPSEQPSQQPSVPRPNGWKKLEDFLIQLIAAGIAGALAGFLYAFLSTYTISCDASNTLIFAVPSVLAIFLLAGTLHIGLMGTAFPDRAREWWGRLGGWLLLWGLAWLAIFWLALDFPSFFQNDKLVATTRGVLFAKYLTPAWIITTLGGVLAGNSKASGKPGTQSWKDVLAKFAPYVFVVGLLCWISWGINSIKVPKFFAEYPWIADYRLWWALLGCAAVAALMSWRVDVNQFSLHMYYRNRLVRCFLGASNKHRSPNRFTGFDISDDMALKDLRVSSADSYDGPYPVINASLNLVKGKDLAWQERKAESFVMTPRFCGFDVWLEEQDSPMLSAERTVTNPQPGSPGSNSIASNSDSRHAALDRYGYRLTENYAFPPPNRGPYLGLAMGISGAAASPNMGFYSSAPVAFLMTVFNVRLGQWLGNPRNRKTYRRPTPHVGLTYLINELLAGTDDEADYVYLSDGGHFENLALYELVKRRCGLIIVCDAEADSIYGFGGLGNAIRKCRIDLGVDICLDVSNIAPAPDEPSKSHCAIGTVHYEMVDANAPTGTIIYFKASLTGDEPTDVENYAKTHPTFPHESTVDQWFSESQFESYRKLGHHEVISSILGETSCGLAAARAVASGSAPASVSAASAPASPNTMRSPLPPEISVDDPNTPVIERAAAHLASVANSAALAARTGHARKTEEGAANAKALSLKLRKELVLFGFESSELGGGSK